MTNRNELAFDAFLSAGGRLDQLLQRGTPKYFIKSTDVKPADAVLGSELYYVDTGDYFVYYDNEWHLKVQGNYSDIKFTLTAVKGDLASAVSPATLEVTYDKAYGTLPTTTPTEGYELEGWYFDSELTDEVSATDIVRIEDDADIYAKHVTIDYPITYNLDGGVNDPANPATYTVLDAVTFLAPTKEGFTFDSWHNAVTLNSPVTGWIAGSTGAYEVWAKYLENFTVTFNSNGGSAVDAQEIADGSLATEPTPPTLDGSTFEGWYTDNDVFVNAFVFTTPITADITLYAKFTEVTP